MSGEHKLAEAAEAAEAAAEAAEAAVVDELVRAGEALNAAVVDVVRAMHALRDRFAPSLIWDCPRCNHEPSDDDPNHCGNCYARDERERLVKWLRDGAKRMAPEHTREALALEMAARMIARHLNPDGTSDGSPDAEPFGC